MKKVIVFGTFDILHPGHIHMLKEAKALGDYLVVVLARDETVLRVKGKKPRNDENARLKNLGSLGIADKIRLGSLDNKHKVIAEEKPDIIALGYDQSNFTENLADIAGSSIKIVRLKPFKPEIYKSSLIKNHKFKISNHK